MSSYQRPLILLTVPHTGTHTLHYLFAVLGGAKVYWNHFDRHCFRVLEKLFAQNLDEAVIVVPSRGLETLRKSWESRGHKSHDLAQSLEAHKRFMSAIAAQRFTFTFPIDAPSYAKTIIAKDIFEQLNITPSEEAEEFMKHWPRLNTAEQRQQDIILGEANGDALSRSLRSRVSNYLEDYHGVHLKPERVKE